MYSAIKHRRGSRLPLFLIALVCVVYLVSYTTVGFAANNMHKPGTVEMTAINADIIDRRGVSEETKAICSGNVVNFDIIGISGPGTGAMARLTVKNTGTLSATLVSADTVDPMLDFMKLSVIDFPIGEVIKPGECCIFDVGIYWDPARTDITKTTIDDSFQILLTYENNEMIPVDPDNPNPSPKTGDNSHTELFTVIAVVCGIVLVVCLLLMIFGKKKKEDDENE